jgi:hypothetical protein
MWFFFFRFCQKGVKGAKKGKFLGSIDFFYFLSDFVFDGIFSLKSSFQ